MNCVTVEICIFFLIFYICLGAFFLGMLSVYYHFVDPIAPRYQGANSFLNTPGMNFHPRPEEGTLIKFSKNSESYKNYVSQLSDILNTYKRAAKDFQMYGNFSFFWKICSSTSTAENSRSCVTEKKDLEYVECNEMDSFGFVDAKPCILLRLNKVYGWVPSPYQHIVQGMNNYLKQAVHIEGYPDMIWISCDGRGAVDKEHVDSAHVFYPQPGWPTYYFPYKNQHRYLPPYVWVKFTRLPPHQAVMVVCRAWARNIDYNLRDLAGSTHFELFIGVIRVSSEHEASTDSYGTNFIFPVPFCNRWSYIRLVVAPRDWGPATLRFGDNLVRYAEIKSGNSKTIPVSCTFSGHVHAGEKVPNGCMHVESNTEVSIRVLYGQNSFQATPTQALHTSYSPVLFRDAIAASKEVVYFLSVGVVEDNTSLNLTGITLESKVSKLQQFDHVVFYPSGNMDNITLTSSQPVFLLTGSFVRIPGEEMKELLLVEDMPREQWGKFYILPFLEPTNSVFIALRDGETKVRVTITSSNGMQIAMNVSHTKLGQFYLADQKGFVTVSATSVLMPVFLLRSKGDSIRDKVVLRTVPPLERYLTHPCLVDFCYRTSSVTIVAGMLTKRLDTSPYKVLSNTIETKVADSPFWVRLVNQASLSQVADSIFSSPTHQRLWFFEVDLVKQGSSQWSLNSAARSLNVNQSSCRSSPSVAGDEVDNDCDGVVDEEDYNQDDDDGDGMVDEDLGWIKLTDSANLTCTFKPKIDEKSVQKEVKEAYKNGFYIPRDERYQNIAFAASTITAIFGVILFISAFFVIDFLERPAV